MEKVVPKFDKPWPPHFPNIPEFAEVNGTSASETLGPGLAWKGSHIHAGDGWDSVYAGSGQDTVWGDGGRDQIYGGDGNDTLYGGSEGDWLFGEANDDMIIGDDGDDAIVGGAGIDTLYGGLGADSFHWNNISETGVSAGFGGDKDVIGDFNPWQGDQIFLGTLANNAGLQTLSFVGFHHQDTFTAPGQIGWDYDFNNNINIWINTDSDPQAEAGISVQFTGFQPDASWFHF